jgi:hypothetical protein
MKSSICSCAAYPLSHDPETWVAHCLDFDLVTQGPRGSGRAGALKSLLEALWLVLSDDARFGYDSGKRRAPPHVWAENGEHAKPLVVCL